MIKFLFLLLFCSFEIFSQVNVKDKIDKILSKIPSTTTAGVQITNPYNGEIIYEHNSKKILIPASNTKLFTTATALNLMGLTYEFTTKLFTDDIDLKDGVVNGNLYIKGFGNSMFTEKDIDDYISELKEQKVTKITGDVVGDDSYLDNNYYRDDWIEGEAANVPLPAVSGLILNRNLINVRITASSKSATISITPKNDFVIIKSSVKTTTRRRKPSARLSFANGKYTVVVTGQIRRNTTVDLSLKINNPPFFAASVLYSKLKDAEIEINGDARDGITPSSVNFISSTPVGLVDIINRVNKRSDNYLAECLFKSIGAFYSLKQGNSFYSSQAVNSYINEHNIYSEGVSLVDGSGISRSNEVTVKTISDLLVDMFNKPIFYETFKNSLSIAGVEGTLRDRLNSNLSNKFYGKTGTLNGISAVSGYLETKSQDYIVLSMIFDFKTKDHDYYKKIQDGIIELIENEF